MKDFDITKLPFTSISRENWEMLLELDKDSLYDVMQKIGNYVLTGERCDCDNTLSKIVCNQVISVIDRKGQAYCKTTGNLKPREKKVQEPQPAQEPPKENKYKDMPWEEYLKKFISRHPSFNYDMNVDSFVSTYVETLEQFQKFVYENFYTVEKIPIATLAFEILYYKEQGKVYTRNGNQ